MANGLPCRAGHSIGVSMCSPSVLWSMSSPPCTTVLCWYRSGLIFYLVLHDDNLGGHWKSHKATTGSGSFQGVLLVECAVSYYPNVPNYIEICNELCYIHTCKVMLQMHLQRRHKPKSALLYIRYPNLSSVLEKHHAQLACQCRMQLFSRCWIYRILVYVCFDGALMAFDILHNTWTSWIKPKPNLQPRTRVFFWCATVCLSCGWLYGHKALLHILFTPGWINRVANGCARTSWAQGLSCLDMNPKPTAIWQTPVQHILVNCAHAVKHQSQRTVLTAASQGRETHWKKEGSKDTWRLDQLP